MADHVVAVDGRYEHFPSDHDVSAPEQYDAIRDGCTDGCMGLTLQRSCAPWPGEVEKRAAMFDVGLSHAASADDWFLIVDADVQVENVADGWREALTTTVADCAKVRCRNVRPDGKLMDDVTYRGFYRALPGLTVQGAHWNYVIPGANPRYLWMDPSARVSTEFCADLTPFVTVHHRNLDRTAERSWAARMYYRKRDELTLERAPHW